MNINKIEVGKEYLRTNSHGQPPQKIVVLRKNVKESTYYEEGETTIDIEYTSDDCTKGLRTTMNEIECMRYVHGPILNAHITVRTYPQKGILTTKFQ